LKQAAAVIGLGFVGRAHLEALRRVGVPLRGVLASSPERGAALRESLDLPSIYASLDELAADPAVSVVHICTPNHLHFAQAGRMLRAGKHVLCEKPLAMDSRESEMLVKLEKDTGCVGAAAYNLRYYPLCQEARAAVASGVIGRRDAASELLPKDPSLLSPAARAYAAYPAGHAEGYPDTFVQLFREFYAYLDAGDFAAPCPFPTFADGNHELLLCEASAKSAQDRAWIPVLLE